MDRQIVRVLMFQLLLFLFISRSKSVHTSKYDRIFKQWIAHINRTSDPNPINQHYLKYRFGLPTDRNLIPGIRFIVVGKDGTGDYTTIQEAVNSVPDWSTTRTIISILPGIYREKVLISTKKTRIMLLGERFRTFVVWNDTAGTRGANGMPLRTFHSATVEVNAEKFIARDIIFENSAPAPKPDQRGGQAAALRISGDKAAFYNCIFLGHQDTLYDHRGRHYFKNCYIEGTVDFIFGNGRSLYQNCQIYTLAHDYVGSVTAQRRYRRSLQTGFSFLHSSISGSGMTYLGRAWGPSSNVVFLYTWMGNIVSPQGWNDWGKSDRDKTVFYAQFMCSGPGSNMAMRVKWSKELTPEEARPFMGIGFINGQRWLQQL